MRTYFNLLPTDVIRYEIIPFLDYHSRVALNIYLDNDEKVIMPLNRDKIAQIAMMMATGPIRKALDKATNAFGITRRRAILRLLSVVLPRHMVLTQYNSGFRAVIENKIETYIDPSNREYDSSCERFKNSMIEAVSRLRVLLDTKYPYLYSLTCLKEDIWSPVDENNTNLVVTANGLNMSSSQYGKTKYTSLGNPPSEKEPVYLRYRSRRRRYSSYDDYDYDTDYSY
jgi:hypothetical protein